MKIKKSEAFKTIRNIPIGEELSLYLIDTILCKLVVFDDCSVEITKKIPKIEQVYVKRISESEFAYANKHLVNGKNDYTEIEILKPLNSKDFDKKNIYYNYSIDLIETILQNNKTFFLNYETCLKAYVNLLKSREKVYETIGILYDSMEKLNDTFEIEVPEYYI